MDIYAIAYIDTLCAIFERQKTERKTINRNKKKTMNETGVFFDTFYTQPINIGYSIDFKQNKLN